ncbi:transient receptor potential cation channel subfamily M member 6-like [Mytilus californianus]|uniref:transient receptor potential cation channel subfamily M member 6-like n=1 Tax=Mytilus californianus TaxID=6549 RepID=UPI00224634B0|nr:transient receptor potential cation channel subfamily M member 6-like [Mytilus californianus]
MPTIEILRLAVLINRRETAAVLWYHCDNPIMTALISSIYLTSLANTAEQTFDEKDQEELQNHADLFLSRAIQLLEKMFSDNERLAKDALDYVSEIWEHYESPLHFGHQFNIEEFISHPSNQKDASKRLFSYNLTEDKNIQSGSNQDNRTSNANELQIQESTTVSGCFLCIGVCKLFDNRKISC